jgi:MFS superfamily sulfate permease-like transporter
LRGDLVAGVTVAAYLMPHVMAYATVAGLRPVVGLWAALPALVIYALLGSSPSLSMGPEATTALMQPSPLRWFVLNAEANVEVDFTALEAVDALRQEITSRGAVFAVARVKQDLLARLRAFGLASKIGEDLLFPTLPTAVDAYRTWVQQHEPPPGSDTATS